MTVSEPIFADLSPLAGLPTFLTSNHLDPVTGGLRVTKETDDALACDIKTIENLILRATTSEQVSATSTLHCRYHHLTAVRDRIRALLPGGQDIFIQDNKAS